MTNFDRVNELQTRYPDTAAAALEAIATWSSDGFPLVPPEAMAHFLAEAPLATVHDSFWRQIVFGTGGVRGPVGFGPNRINPSTVAFTIQAHCELLKSEGRDGEHVVVATDVRAFGGHKDIPAGAATDHLREVSSRSLSHLAARVYLANGFGVYLMIGDGLDGVLTTPELSFVIRHSGACGGVNLSASHNPPADNGVKVYSDTGGQYLSPLDDKIAALATEVMESQTLPPIAQDAWMLEPDGVQQIPAEWLEAYRGTYESMVETDRMAAPEGAPQIVYTPLAGCGERHVSPILADAGYDLLIPADQHLDPSFTSIPLLAPNPEVPESTAPSKAFAEEHDIDLVLSTDPDGDRIGAEVRVDGAWRHLTGNELATLIAHYLYLDEDGPRRTGTLLKTVVTTMSLDGIAERAGIPFEGDLLVGFKHAAERIHVREAEGGFTFGFAVEESHGVMLTADIRDKDGVGGALVLAHLHTREQVAGRTIMDYLADIEAELGRAEDIGRSLVARGAEGVSAISTLMDQLRAGDVDLGHGFTVSSDYWDTDAFGEFKSASDRSARNIVVFENGTRRVTVRPSGTEPKLKYYVQGFIPAGADQPDTTAEELADDLYSRLAASMGTPVPAPFASLSDVISLDDKARVAETVGEVESAVSDGTSDEEALATLAEVAAAAIPGGDPLRPVAVVVATASDRYPNVHRILVDAG